MKLFLDRNRTLLPQIDLLYLITRAIVFFSIAWYIFFEIGLVEFKYFYFPILIVYVIHLLHFHLANKGKLDIKLAYLASIIIDLLLVPLLIIKGMGDNNPYFLVFFLTVSVAAYVLTFRFSIIVISLVTVLYINSIFFTHTDLRVFDLSLTVSFFWINYIVVLYGSKYLRKSEKRLLKLLNTLNMRTSELEKSQAHLEMIYENTRILASLLDSKSLVEEIMKILDSIQRFEGYGIILQDKDKNFYYRARYQSGRINFNLKSINIAKMELLHRVSEQSEAIIVKDVSNRNDYEPLNSNTKSIMIVPIEAHNKKRGFLVTESSVAGGFKDFDLQMLTAISQSAALAFENAELHKRTEELTISDELTGINNFRYFIKKLEEEKRRASRYDLPLSLIMIDIDHFKKLNDRHGHESGNLVLKKLAKIIQKCIRDVDIFARYGGEEFAVILPQTPQKVANKIGERIRKQVEKAEFLNINHETINITVSIGLSSYPENGFSEEELVSVADQALYRAKGEGRNKVCVT